MCLKYIGELYMCQEERRGGSTNTSRRGISLGSEQEGDSPVAASASAPEPRHPDTESALAGSRRGVPILQVEQDAGLDTSK